MDVESSSTWEGPWQTWKSKHFLNARAVVKFIAALDIFYALCLIAIHLLSLITRQRSGTKLVQLTLALPPSVTTVSTVDVASTPVTPHASSAKNPSDKPRETLEVLLWVVMFALSILQLLVAGALYGGTKQKESRICIRNCRIWAFTSSFLIFIILLQVSWILLEEIPQSELFRLTVYCLEILLRLAGILAIHKLKMEIRNEQCNDLEDMEYDTIYYEVQTGITPSPSPRKGSFSTHLKHHRPARRLYHRTDAWDELDFNDV